MSEPTAERATRYFMNRDELGRITYGGVDKGGRGAVIAENDSVLVVEFPAGKHWVGRGLPHAHHPATIDVLRKDGDGRFTLLISWEKRRMTSRKAALQETAK